MQRRSALVIALIFLGVSAIYLRAQQPSKEYVYLGGRLVAIHNDDRPPVISGLSVIEVHPTSAKIQWTTDEPADTEIRWGLTTSYGTPVLSDTSPRKVTHTANLTGLGSNATYHFSVRSTDTAGNQASWTSDQTFFVPGCNYSLNPPSPISVGPGAAPGSVAVTADCAWTATSNASWISVTSGASGTGNGTIGYQVLANPDPSSRSGTISVGPLTLTINQAPSGCTYTVSPLSQSFTWPGASSAVSVTAAPGCGWNVDTTLTPTTWLKNFSPTSGSGNGSVAFTVDPNTGAQRTGTFKVAGQTVTVTQGAAATNQPPTAQSVSPNAGASGNIQQFTAFYTDPDGYSDLATVEFAVKAGSTVDYTDSCWIKYDRAANALYVASNTNGAWGTALTPGNASTVSNTRCILRGNNSSATPSGSNTLILVFDIQFQSGFAGNKTLFLKATDAHAATSGVYFNAGNYNVVDPATPVAQTVSVTPSSGSGTGGLFNFLYRHPSGNGQLVQTESIVNATLGAANACQVIWVRGNNALWLTTDSGGYLPSGPPGGSGALSNSQCTLNLAETSVTYPSGTDMSVNEKLFFNPAFVGTKNLYTRVQCCNDTGYFDLGNYTVTAATNYAPVAVSVSPLSGSGSSQTFTALYSDANGFPDVRYAEFLINSTLNFASGCYVRYDRAANYLSLRNDAGTAWIGAGIAHTNVAPTSNSQCTLDVWQSTASPAGNNVTLNLALSFQTTFQGAKTTYMWVQDMAGLESGYQSVGAWTAPDTTAPAISNVGSGSITASGAAITWTTNEAADSLVEYGTTVSYGSASTLNSSLVASHSVSLSGLAASTLYHYRVKSKDASNNLATSGDFTFTTPPASGFTPIRVNAGSTTAYTDSQGRVWAADSGYTGGWTEMLHPPQYAISGTSSPGLYDARRFEFSGNTFSYAFAVPNGNYRVTLKFAEKDLFWPGQRMFNVSINGTQVLTNFDIAATAGHSVALDRTFAVNVTGGQIQASFQSVNGSRPMVSGIEIVSASDPDVTLTSASPGVLTAGQTYQFTASASGVTWTVSPAGRGTISSSGLYTAPATLTAAERVTVTAALTSDPKRTASALVVLNPVPTLPLRINAGGSQYTDGGGKVWAADSSSYYCSGYSTSTTSTISGTTDQPLYQTGHWEYGLFCYALLMPNGTYTVNLKFADAGATAAGQRVFNVVANGTTQISGLDIFAAAGGALKALDRTFSVTVTNGELILDFQPTTGYPLVNAIEIVGNSTYSIGGQVTSGGTGLSGVTMTLSGSSSQTVTTDSSGNYSLGGVAGGGSYTVTPSKSGYAFTPASFSYPNLGASQAGQNFTASVVYSIAGQTTSGGTGLSGVTMTLSGSASQTATTDGSGNYSFSALAAGGNYTVTPSKTGYTFAPASFSYTNLSANQTGQNFAGTLLLPTGWAAQDIGSVPAAGSTTWSAGTFTEKGAGSLNALSDSIHFAYTTLTGNGQIKARIVSSDYGGQGMVAVMMRDSLTASARYAAAGRRADIPYGLFQRRLDNGDSYGDIGTQTLYLPQWFRVVRAGNVFTGYSSADGNTWQQIFNATITMGNTIYVGLVSIPQSSSATLATTTIDNVTVQ